MRSSDGVATRCFFAARGVSRSGLFRLPLPSTAGGGGGAEAGVADLAVTWRAPALEELRTGAFWTTTTRVPELEDASDAPALACLGFEKKERSDEEGRGAAMRAGEGGGEATKRVRTGRGRMAVFPWAPRLWHPRHRTTFPREDRVHSASQKFDRSA